MLLEGFIYQAIVGKGVYIPATKALLAKKAVLITKGSGTNAALAKGSGKALIAKGAGSNPVAANGASTNAAATKGAGSNAVVANGTGSSAATAKGGVTTMAATNAAKQNVAAANGTLTNQINHIATRITEWLSKNGITFVVGAVAGGASVSTLVKGKYEQEKEELNQKLTGSLTQLQEVEAKLQQTEAVLFEQIAKLQPKPQVVPNEPEPEPEPELDPEPLSNDPPQDDLKRITGIGIVFAGRLNDAGIFTFAQLAEMTQEKIKEVVFFGKTIRSYNIAQWIVDARQLAGDNEDTTATTPVAQSDEIISEDSPVAQSDEVTSEDSPSPVAQSDEVASKADEAKGDDDKAS